MTLLKNAEEYKRMKIAGEVLAKTMVLISKLMIPGNSAKEIDEKVEEFIYKNGCKPAFKGYQGYPYSICLSINQEVIHGFPLKEKILKNGDIVSVDLGCIYENYYSDMARTFPVGNISQEKARLIEVTKNSLRLGIQQAIPGNRIGDIGYAIQSYVEKNGFSVVKDFVGHGLGSNLHEDPQIPNFGEKGRGSLIKENMAIAIEPMVNAGSYAVYTLPDHWTVVTKDGKDSAHFEDTIFIKKDSIEILTALS
jgi:methionyl aminopeptidase